MELVDHNLAVGDHVTYYDEFNCHRGIVKDITNNEVSVVFDCDNNWDNYRNYQGNTVNRDNLYKGWFDHVTI